MLGWLNVLHVLMAVLRIWIRAVFSSLRSIGRTLQDNFYKMLLSNYLIPAPLLFFLFRLQLQPYIVT